MKKRLLIATIASLLCATSAQSDTLLGLYIGGQVWVNQAEGSFGEGSTDQATFDFKDENQGNYFIALEHPIPLIPNFRIASTTLDTVGGTTIDGSFTIGGETYDVNAQLDTVFDANFVDYTLYYELFDNDLLTFDLGFTVREVEGNINVVEQSSLVSSSLSSTGYLPLLYANTIIGLPFTGFNVFAEANFLSYDDSSVYDYQIGVSYSVLDNLAVDLDVTLGYRSVKLELNDIDNLYSDIKFDGVFAGAIVHF